MLNKIKEKFIHILRKKCGYYSLREDFYKYRDWYHECSEDFVSLMEKHDKLSSQHEAKILEYDILDNKYKTLVDIHTNACTLNNHYDIDEIIKAGLRENSLAYKKYLVAELEQILITMKEKGIHPQDLIKRIINKVNRDIKE